MAVYLGEYQRLPFDRLTEIMRDLFACLSQALSAQKSVITRSWTRYRSFIKAPFCRYIACPPRGTVSVLV